MSIWKNIANTAAALAVAGLFLSTAAAASTPLDPLMMSNKCVGGTDFSSFTHGVDGAVGLYNVGLLIRTTGKVTGVDTSQQFFYIDDGCGLVDDSGFTGVRVSYKDLSQTAGPNVIDPPAKDSYVAVTGISSVVNIGDIMKPVIRPRRQSDIQTYFPL